MSGILTRLVGLRTEPSEGSGERVSCEPLWVQFPRQQNARALGDTVLQFGDAVILPFECGGRGYGVKKGTWKRHSSVLIYIRFGDELTPGWRNVLDTFFQVTIFLWDGRSLFSAWTTWIYSFGPDGGSLINQELFLDPIRTVFNYFANFNAIEETVWKQPVSPKQLAKQGEKDPRGRVMGCVASPEKKRGGGWG